MDNRGVESASTALSRGLVAGAADGGLRSHRRRADVFIEPHGLAGQLVSDPVELPHLIQEGLVSLLVDGQNGMFVSTLACKLNGRIAAVAPVAGVHVLPDCAGRPMPIIVTHGTSDRVVPFDETDVGVPLAATGY